METNNRLIDKACITFLKNKENILKFNRVIKPYQIGFDLNGNMALVQNGKAVIPIIEAQLNNIVAGIYDQQKG